MVSLLTKPEAVRVVSRSLVRENCTLGSARGRWITGITQQPKVVNLRDMFMNKTATVVWWTARILSVPVVLLWAFFIITYAIGPERSLPRNFTESIAYAAMIVSILALAISWRWELGGSIVTLVAVVIGTAINWHGSLSLVIVIPINAILFLLSWWLRRSARQV
jgi:hypothetical protein